jgi:AraC-like DNA-binding protein
MASPRHALLIPVVSRVFEDLGVAASLWEDGQWPAVVHQRQGLLDFEYQHGTVTERFAYNGRCIARARRTGRSIVGRYGGLSDLFAPIRVDGRVRALIVTGPFLTARPTSADILERWRTVTGEQGHPNDPEFLHYVTAMLETLVLDGRRLATFTQMVEALALLLGGQGAPDDIRQQIASLDRELGAARFVDRVWDAARSMVDERTSRTMTTHSGEQLRGLGLARFPERVVAGLLVSRRPSADPLDDLLRRHELQRECVEMARAAGHAISGRIGNHGITLLSTGSARKLADLARRAQQVANDRFGLVLHTGISAVPAPLPVQYQAALAAAEAALASGAPSVTTDGQAPPTNPLGKLRRELATLAEQKPKELPPRFDRYLEAVAARCAYQREPIRAHLEAAFERMTEALPLDPRDAEALRARVEVSAGEASTVNDLLAVYRGAVRDLVSAVERPAAARRERSLQRAEEYLRRHYADRVTLEQAAQVAGFAPTYFSVLFHEKQRMTFADYLSSLRIARAKELLAGTSLSLSRVAELSGLATRQYLCRVFKQRTRETPDAYRRRSKQEIR